MRLWHYTLLILALLALPTAATVGVFGGTETSVMLETPSQTVPPPPNPTPIEPPVKPGFVEEPANIPAPAATTTPTTIPATTAAPPTTIAVPPTTTTASAPPTTAVPPQTDPAVAALDASTGPPVSWELANARPEGIDVFATIDAAAPTIHVTDQTEWGTHRVLPVLEHSGDWLEVLVPVRPNNAVGWVRAGSVDLTQGIDEIHVSLANLVLEWKHGAVTAMTSPVAIGAPESPTPPGTYYVTDVLATDGPYGPFALALNGHSDTYATFNGGDARIALHGTDAPGTIGEAASHGCVRLPNDAIAVLAHQIPIGTPVFIS